MGTLKLSVAKDATPVNKLAEIESQFIKLQSLMRQKSNLSKLLEECKAYSDRMEEITSGVHSDSLVVTFTSGYKQAEITLKNETLVKLLSEYLTDISRTKLDLLNDQIANFSI